VAFVIEYQCIKVHSIAINDLNSRPWSKGYISPLDQRRLDAIKCFFGGQFWSMNSLSIPYFQSCQLFTLQISTN